MFELSLLFQIIVSVSVFIVWTFRYDNVETEFKEFGYSNLLRNIVGALKISSSTLLIAGIWYTDLIIFGSISMSFFMLCAQISHFKIKNAVIKFLPSLIFLLMSLYITAFNCGYISQMDLNLVIIFTAVSFIIYGYSSFISRRMKSEFNRWGYSNQRKIVGFLQILGGIGFLLGLKINLLLVLTSFCFIVMMTSAILIRIKIKDNITDILPAITYLFLSILIFYNSIMIIE